MPLIVPGVQNTASAAGENSAESWLNKLAGKTLGDSHNETTFSKNDLPKNTRIIQGSGGMGTMDHQADRLNIHTNDKGIIENVKFG